MKYVQSVTGPIMESDLGYTLSHEHLFTADWSMRVAFGKEWVDPEVIMEQAVGCVQRAMRHGIRTIMDITPINLGRDVEFLREVARRTGVNVLVATGFYWNEDLWQRGKSQERIVKLLLREIEHGVQGTEIKAAVIKCATGIQGITPENVWQLEVAAKTHLESGMPIYTHTEGDPQIGMGQLERMMKLGVDPRYVCIGHLSNSTDVDAICRLLDLGCYAGMDKYAYPAPGLTPEMQSDTVAELIRRGYADQILLSHDFCVFHDQNTSDMPDYYGRDVNKLEREFTWVSRRLLPALRERGIPEDAIDGILGRNPARFFCRKEM